MALKELQPIVFIICFFLAIIYFVYLRLKHKERMEMIKQGNHIDENNDKENLKFSVLSKAIILLSLSIGLVLALVISSYVQIERLIIIIYTICICGCCGIGLLIYYLIISKVVKD